MSAALATWLAFRALRWLGWLGFLGYSVGFFVDPRSHFDNFGQLYHTTEASLFGFALLAIFAGFFELMLKSRAAVLRDDEDVPLSFKIVGALSLLAWLNVLYWGRMLPFWSPPGGGADL